MKSFHLYYVLCIALIFNACKDKDSNSNLDEGVVTEDTYVNKEIGWTIKIPEGWDIVDSDMQREIQKKGLDAMEDANDIVVDASGVKNLISFKKDQFNSFLSTSESYNLTYDDEWDANFQSIKDYIISTYQNEGIEHDATATTSTTIDGLEFKTYTFTLYDRNGKELLKQVMFGRYINGADFGVCINYNNEDDKEVMMEVFKQSKFRKSKS